MDGVGDGQIELREHASLTMVTYMAKEIHWWKTDEEAFLLQWSEIG